MKSIIDNYYDTDKQINLALGQSPKLSNLLSIGSISTGALSLFSVAAILGTQPAQAYFSVQSASLPDETVKEKPSSHTIYLASEKNFPTEAHQEMVEGKSFQTTQVDFCSDRELCEQTIPESSWERHTANSLNLLVMDEDVELSANPSENLSEQGVIVPTHPSVAQLSNINSPHRVERTEFTQATQLRQAHPVEVQPQPKTVVTTGAAALTGIQPAVIPSVAQGVEQEQPEPDSIPQNSESYDPLSPSLDVQGVFLNQVDSSARLRLRGFYPVSPNALFGAIVDLATGNDFAGTEDSGLNLSELYFTGNLPEYPHLRLVVGLMDLTSYFDRNSFAKDNTTHFFNNAFQTNPALATAGIGSRLGVLLNWNITDNIEAKGAAFSSNRNLGDFALDAFAGEIGLRAGNGIIRATYSTNQDTGRDGIVGFPTNQAPLFFERGTENGDREDAFGVNGEYFIPQINMGVFARYGWHENRELERGADTYSLGVNFLDLFIKDDRLGFGYGRNLSNEDGRRIRGDKEPDVWELFYDARISPNFRAGVTLQARDEFSDVILGFRVRTDWQIFP